eukprot:CAMPEP_0194218180 /NCGR_PEP_ID=MMETSP0156-20130528/23173_1 /TAXON_ID=33649 /ORGANISM="Thalassionema nitzschioides, Strain L26-B" /LENGTH=173 /DNA_ID=CAMNT_0038947439 /DNA_START=108 /DNA_END=629 /DNA_ORIENTATION=-
MKPRIQQARSFSYSSTGTLVPRWGKHELNEQPIKPQSYPSLEEQRTSTLSPQEFQVPVVDALHKRDRPSQALNTFTHFGASISADIDSRDVLERQNNGKRSRGNTYRAPREIKQTVTSVMGSLVGGTSEESPGVCQMRRQLSGSQLETFVNSGDAMVEDDFSNVFTRERAMSF